MAVEWGIEPWRVRAEAPAAWVDRWAVVKLAQAKAAKIEAERARGQAARR